MLKKICLKLFLLLKVNKNKSFIQKQPPEGFFKKAFLKTFTKLTWKHLCWSLFFNKFHAWCMQRFNKGTPTQVFSGEFCGIFKITFFTEHFPAIASFRNSSYSFIFQRSFIYLSNLLLLEKSTKTHNFAIFSFSKYILYSILRMYFIDQNINTGNHISLMR